MGRPSKPLEVKRKTGRSPGRDSGGRKLPEGASVTALPGASDVPPAPGELVTSGRARECFITKGRARSVDEDEADYVDACEACLADVGVEAWTRLWQAGMTWLSVKTDVDVLTRICKARIEEAHHRLALAEDGYYVAGQRGGMVAHPAVSMLRQLNAEVVKLESLCGFTPSDRGRLGVGEVKPGGSPIEQLIAKRVAARSAAKVPARATPRGRAVGSDTE
jgi:P27 family predicted phage terminase small subunit